MAEPGSLTLRHGAHRVEIFDPRPDPLALGARYVNGGYVAAWWHGDRCLTVRPQPEWDPYVGQGLPEVFEYPLGRDAAQPGEEFLRIGAGRLRKDPGHWPQAGGLPSTPVSWEITEHTAASIAMHCSDQIGGFGYDLTRTITVHDDGLESCTTLQNATQLAFSVEPYLARAWHDDETGAWSIRYRLL